MTASDAAFDDAELNGFVDGRLEPARAAALAAALAGDPGARARVDGWKRQNDSLRSLFASVLFEPVPVRLVATGLAPRPAGRPAPTTASPVPPPRTHPAGAVAVAVVGMGLIGFALGAWTGPGLERRGPSTRPAADAAPEPARGLAARAIEAHRAYLMDGIRPVELGPSDGPRLLRWIQSRLGAPIRVPDLRALGWSFAGGRVIPGSDGPTAFLVFANGGERLAVSVGRSAGGPTEARRAGEPIRVASWSDGVFDYAVTTTRDGDWLARNAPALEAAIGDQGAADGLVP